MIVKRDIFPSIVNFTSSGSDHTSQISIARVVQTESRVVIAQDTMNGPVIIFNEEFTGTPTWNGSEGSFLTTTGVEITYKKDSACGCGSRLRSWNPYGSIVNSSQDPTA